MNRFESDLSPDTTVVVVAADRVRDMTVVEDDGFETEDVVVSNEIIKPKVTRPIKPRVEQALRMYACGMYKTQHEAAVAAGLKDGRFSIVINSDQGQKILNSVRGELDLRYQTLYNKFIDVVESALDHADPAVALAGASLFAKTQIGTKIRAELTAEDVVQQLLNGTYTAKED